MCEYACERYQNVSERKKYKKLEQGGEWCKNLSADENFFPKSI